MADDSFNGIKSFEGPATHAAAITPVDATDLAEITRGIFTGSGGSIVVLLGGDTATVTLTNVPAGIVLPLRIKRVYLTGTTATGLIALY